MSTSPQPQSAGNFSQPEALNTLLDTLAEQRWAVTSSLIDPHLCLELHTELHRWERDGALHTAHIGQGQARTQDDAQRGDRTRWLDGSTPAQQAYLTQMQQVQTCLNRALYLGLKDYEAHYALYPPGTFYKRHVDNFRGRSSRVVTSLLYLNPHWQPGDGGEMLLYPDATDAAQRVEPRLGTFVLFMAEDLPHEVLPTRVPRGSIAGWFRRDLR